MTRGLALETGALASGALIFAAAPAATAATTDGDTAASATQRVGPGGEGLRGAGAYLGARLVPSEDGATVAHVIEGSPADSAGIAEGDIVLTIDGVSIDQRSALRDALSGAAEGDELTVVFTHDGAEESAVVTVAARADRPAKPSRDGATSADGVGPADGARADAKGEAGDGSSRKAGGAERGAQRGGDSAADAATDAQSA